jgi:hypothetical protein
VTDWHCGKITDKWQKKTLKPEEECKMAFEKWTFWRIPLCSS